MSTVKNKAFTIVELVIVIFVLAVLAAVLIPTFSNVIRRANVAKDTQLVRNLNTALALEAAAGNRPATASVAAEMCGCDKKNIVSAVSGNVILWDSVNNVFCYYDSIDDEYVYVPEDGAITPPSSIKAYQYWEFYLADKPIPDVQKYSVCLADGYTLDVPTSFKVGVDAGNNEGIDINYVGSSGPQTVYIRTNGGTLTVSAPLDTVYHYGVAEGVVVYDVATDCYHENGTVFRLKYDDDNGKIILGDSAVVYCYMNTSSDSDADAGSARSAGAVVYSSASGGNVVDVSTGHAHGEFDEMHTANGIYLVCKKCGGHVKISQSDNISEINVSALTLIDAIGSSTPGISTPVTVTGITLNKNAVSVRKGETDTVTATVNFSNGSSSVSENVAWQITGGGYAALSAETGGSVTLSGVNISGETALTLTASFGGRSANCSVEVLPPVSPAVESISLGDTLSLAVGTSSTLTATVSPSGAGAPLSWHSSDDSVATVDQNGEVTGVSSGTATITVSAADGSKSATCAVTVGVVRLGSTAMYSSLEDAISAAQNGDVITLLADATLNSAVNIVNKSITIDGGSHTLTVNSSLAGANFITVAFGGTDSCVIFKDITVNANGGKIGLSLTASDAENQYSAVVTKGTVGLSNIVIDVLYSGDHSAKYRALCVYSGTTTLGDGASLISSTTRAGICETGGGAYVSSGASLVVSTGSSISGFKAASGGGVYNLGTLTLSGGVISGNISTENGGGINNHGGTVNMDGGSVSNNEASSGGGVYIGPGSNGSETSVFNLSGGTIGSNTATYGGGLYVQGAYATLNITGGNVTENAATSGGGIAVNAATLAISDGSVDHNTVTSSGGGIYVSAGTLNITGGAVVSNTATYGGGIVVNAANLTIDGGSVDYNTATSNGGGIYASAGTLNICGGSISYNNARNGANNYTSSNKGGGIYVSSGTLTMTSGEVSYNSAYGGGGMYIIGASGKTATVTISGGNIEHNTASQNGGAFNVNEYATLYLSGCTVSGNTAANGKTWRRNNGTVYLNNVQNSKTNNDSAIN